MQTEKGSLSINSENILPIIKKWLYSDTDIFVRELVSNGADAVAKLKRLRELGEAAGVAADEVFEIHVSVDKDGKLIKFEDNGIGMTADEVKEYINQIAFSGANDFIEKYKDRTNGENDMIGHFGLGFYSAFMVASKVEVDTLSYAEGAEAVRWISDGGGEYEMEAGERTSRGTTVTLHIMEGEEGFLEAYKLSGILRKYCGFLPVPIFFDSGEKKAEAEPVVEDTAGEGEEGEEPVKPTPINDVNPLWQKQPKDCTDDEYKEFYHKVFSDFNDPLFWIHLNMDYPFRLKGILYFPKLRHEIEYIEGQVKLYNNQVFIADNIKEVIPEFLLLLKGTIDCPDLPLNVSRSFLQNDGYVKKMSGYITKKIADKINGLYKKDTEAYKGYWEDISPFIKYGCIKEKDFYDKIKQSLLFKTTAGDYVSLDGFLERNKEKTGQTVFYVSDERQQTQYIKLFKEQGMEAAVLTSNLDNPFISWLESYEKDVHFNRIDSDLSEALKDDGAEEDKALDDALTDIFKEALGDDKLIIKAESLKTDDVPAIMLQSEHARRMEEMSKMFGGTGGMPESMFAGERTLVLNRGNGLVKAVAAMKADGGEGQADEAKLICEHIYDLALMSHRPLDAEAMSEFIKRSNRILGKIAGVE